ncbi:MAG: UDP-N-acetylmuramoyl-L-alanine--D-glutamate ligase [Oscillospiraceae bacterium]|nr:UDP-N-acetylmuramoyl-L-alanine--D-glutamate ligase [Oscillospiraceae bacterium]
MTKAERFFSDIKDKKVAFIGTGVSHNDLIGMFLNKKINVTVCDKKTREEMGELADKLEEKGAKLSLGENYLDAIYSCDIVFRTPGMYYLNPALKKARNMGIAVTSEMEVFFDLCPCKIYAITGTDGKTTTTTVISEILSRSGKTVHKGGNIGRALLPIIEEIQPDDIAVVELSSFQLISMRKSPDVAAITNIYPDHLNVHSSMEEYIGAKKNLIAHQNAFSKTVLNYDNADTNALSDDVRGSLFKFSIKGKVDRGAYLDEEGWLCFNDGKKTERIVHKDKIRIPGMHNVENYLTAIAVVYGEVPVSAIVETAENFGGVEHRIEFVRELDGVKYYNDSIATSPVSVIAGLNAFDRRLIVIAGGSDKKLDYNQLAEPINERVKVLVLTGATADKIEAAVKGYEHYDENNCRIIRAASMEEAVKAARGAAEKGDVITLSPASASFDCYKNFEERGRHFKSIVNGLE